MLDIRITDDDVREWRAKAADLEEQLQALRRKLELVDLCSKDGATSHSPELPGIGAATTNISRAETILSVMREKNRFLTPLEIKDALRVRGETETVWNKDFVGVHSVMQRLKQQGKIVKAKTSKKYRLPETEISQGVSR